MLHQNVNELYVNTLNNNYYFFRNITRYLEFYYFPFFLNAQPTHKQVTIY